MKLSVFYFLLCYSVPAFSQTASVIFKADTTVTVTLYREIDKAYNKGLPTNTIRISPNNSSSCQIEVTDFSFMNVQYSTGRNCMLLIFPRNKIEVNYFKNKISFQGDNQQGLVLLNKHFTTDPHIYIENQSNALNQYSENKINYNVAKTAIQKDTSVCRPLAEMEKHLLSDKISIPFINVVKDNIKLFKQAYNMQGLRTLLLSP